MDVVLEEVARDLLLVVRRYIGDAVDAVWDEMAVKDAAYFGELGQPVPDTPKPDPTVASFYLGHHPSILEHPIADYPNITVVSYDHNTAGDTAADQYEVVASRAYVEAFVVHPDESTVNRLAWRYAKALHRVVTLHKGLDDSTTVEPITAAPDVQVSNAAARRVEQFREEITYIQGCRLEYVFRTPEPW